jgi:hypothetical protein
MKVQILLLVIQSISFSYAGPAAAMAARVGLQVGAQVGAAVVKEILTNPKVQQGAKNFAEKGYDQVSAKVSKIRNPGGSSGKANASSGTETSQAAKTSPKVDDHATSHHGGNPPEGDSVKTAGNPAPKKDAKARSATAAPKIAPAA